MALEPPYLNYDTRTTSFDYVGHDAWYVLTQAAWNAPQESHVQRSRSVSGLNRQCEDMRDHRPGLETTDVFGLRLFGP